MPEHLSLSVFEDDWFMAPSPASMHTKQAPKNNIRGKSEMWINGWVCSERVQKGGNSHRRRNRDCLLTVAKCEPSAPTVWHTHRVQGDTGENGPVPGEGKGFQSTLVALWSCRIKRGKKGLWKTDYWMEMSVVGSSGLQNNRKPYSQ